MYDRSVDGLLQQYFSDPVKFVLLISTVTTTTKDNFDIVVIVVVFVAGLIDFVFVIFGGFMLMKTIMDICLFKLVVFLYVVVDSNSVMAASRLRFDRFPLRSSSNSEDPKKPLRKFPLKAEDDEIERNTLPKKFNFKNFPLKTEDPITPKFKRLPLTEGREIFRFNHTANQNCQTFRFHQKIEHPGCKPRYIVNHGCFGYCNSFMHIVGNGEDKGQDLKFVQICDNDHTKYRPVKLKCPGRKKGYKLKSVLIVKTCKCRQSIPIRRRSINPDHKDQSRPMTTLEPGLSND